MAADRLTNVRIPPLRPTADACPDCQGAGRLWEQIGDLLLPITCARCGGEGWPA